jgi:3'-phosphoadenosine 5'-phosphosulfate sulfotransferase (PAPS reductase)/FAD synthetase
LGNTKMTLDLFDATIELRPSLARLEEDALAAITRVLAAGHPVVVAYSAGKDSTACVALTLQAARDLVAKGLARPQIVVLNSDTRVENPKIRSLVSFEMAKMRAFAKRHGVRLFTHVAEPGLLSTFQLKVLGGRGLPSYAAGNADCSVDLKVTPGRRARRDLLSRLAACGKAAVTIIGTRLDESARRKANMLARGERHDAPVENADGELVLSPLARWSSDDVFEFLGELAGTDAFTDAAEVLRIYAHSAGTSCAVVADSILQGAKAKGGCGARTGCWTCQQAVDRSLQAMVDYDQDAYGNLKPLLDVNAVLSAARLDLTLRHWVGRTSRAGYVAVEPDVFSFPFIRALTRAFMSIDEDERQLAARQGRAPQFEIMPLDILVALDFVQGLQGISAPFQIWADLDAIRKGQRFALPQPSSVRATTLPATRFIEVGPEWESDAWSGLRSAYFESLTEGSPCQPGLVTLKNGQAAWQLDTRKGLDVDMEVAFYLAEDMLPELVAKHHEWRTHPEGQLSGWQWYLGLGTPTLDHSHQEYLDHMARRTRWKMRRGLALDAPHTAAIAQSIPFSSLPASARAAWSHRASSEGCQLDLLAA